MLMAVMVAIGGAIEIFAIPGTSYLFWLDLFGLVVSVAGVVATRIEERRMRAERQELRDRFEF